jgi:hypothetical protein
VKPSSGKAAPALSGCFAPKSFQHRPQKSKIDFPSSFYGNAGMGASGKAAAKTKKPHHNRCGHFLVAPSHLSLMICLLSLKIRSSRSARNIRLCDIMPITSFSIDIMIVIFFLPKVKVMSVYFV